MLNLDEIPEIQLDLVTIKTEICRVQAECCRRGLNQTSKWLAEINFALRETALPADQNQQELGPGPDLDTYNLAKSYFDLKEYDRAAYFSRNMTSPLCQFLHLYSRLMSADKKRLDDLVDTVTSPDTSQLTTLKQLRAELEVLQVKGGLDGYGLFVYGLVLKKLSLTDLAIPVLCESVRAVPSLWGAWLELSSLVPSRDKLEELQLPDHWCKQVFLAHTYLELQLNELAINIYFGLTKAGLQESTYIMAQVAIAFHNMRQVDEAVKFFKQLSEVDPYRLDNLDTYSNLLYVKEQRVELAHLAHKTNMIDKYRTETCCVIGNYYSLRSQHEKAVVYFQRALKLNPRLVPPVESLVIVVTFQLPLRPDPDGARVHGDEEHQRGHPVVQVGRGDGKCKEFYLGISDKRSRSTGGTTGPGMDWVRRTRSSRCTTTASTTSNRPRSSGPPTAGCWWPWGRATRSWTRFRTP